MHCTHKQLNEELKHKKPSEQVFFVPDSAEEIENFCEKMIKKEPEYIVVRLNPNRDMLMQLSDFLDGYNLDFIKLDARFFDVGVKMKQQSQEIAGRKQKLVKCFCKKLFQNIFSGIWKMASSWASCVSCMQDKKCCVYTKMSLFCYP